jgi:hypothetical protein
MNCTLEFQEYAFDKRLDRGKKPSLGADRAIASHIRGFGPLPLEGCCWYPGDSDRDSSPGFLVHAPGAFHDRFMQIARAGYLRRTGDDFPTTEADLYTMKGFQIKKRGRGRGKTNQERLQNRQEWDNTRAKCDAILNAGGAWSPLDPPEDTRLLPSGASYNLSNPVFKHIEFEIDVHYGNYDTKKRLATKLGLNYETVRKKELREIATMKEMPMTKFTKEQIEDIRVNQGYIAYAHIVLDRGRWFKLDMDRFATYQEALHEIWSKSIDEAFKKARIPKRNTDTRTPESDPALAQAFKGVVVRYEKAFRPENIYIMDRRSPTLVAIAEAAFEADAA